MFLIIAHLGFQTNKCLCSKSGTVYKFMNVFRKNIPKMFLNIHDPNFWFRWMLKSILLHGYMAQFFYSSFLKNQRFHLRPNPDWSKCQECNELLRILVFKLIIIQNYQLDFLHQGFNRLHLSRIFQLENNGPCSFRRNLHTRKMQRSADNIDISQIHIWKATRFAPSGEVSISSFYFRKTFQKRKRECFYFASVS